jgi:hypothetical protein
MIDKGSVNRQDHPVVLLVEVVFGICGDFVEGLGGNV